MAANAEGFRAALNARLRDGERASKPFVEVNSGDLHRAVGGDHNANHQFPVCCRVMEAAMLGGDAIVSALRKGRGASFTIRYQLPR